MKTVFKIEIERSNETGKITHVKTSYDGGVGYKEINYILEETEKFSDYMIKELKDRELTF